MSKATIPMSNVEIILLAESKENSWLITWEAEITGQEYENYKQVGG